MSQLPDNTSLFDILIPGTHDTSSFTISPAQDATTLGLAKTQDASLDEQLSMGARYFDLRPRDYGDGTYPMHHGGIYLNLHLRDDILSRLKAFATNNPSETIIISLKPEHQPKLENGTNFTEDLLERNLTANPYFTTYEDFANSQASLDELRLTYPDLKDEKLTIENPKIPGNSRLNYNIPLGLLRGKILIIIRDDKFSAGEKVKELYNSPDTLFTGIDALTPAGNDNWGDNQPYRIVRSTYSNDLLIQDAYKGAAATFGSKEELMKQFWKRANAEAGSDNMLWFNASNTTSTLGGEGTTSDLPRVKAKALNPILQDAVNPSTDSLGLFKEHIELRGITSMDFINPDLINSFIQYNYSRFKGASNRDDVIIGSQADDTLHALQGNDTIHAGQGNDTLIGGGGGDTLHGGPGNDRFIDHEDSKDVQQTTETTSKPNQHFGDSGDDTFEIKNGTHIIDGGDDHDTVKLPGSWEDYRLKFHPSTDGALIITNAGDNPNPLHATLHNIEAIHIG